MSVDLMQLANQLQSQLGNAGGNPPSLPQLGSLSSLGSLNFPQVTSGSLNLGHPNTTLSAAQQAQDAAMANATASLIGSGAGSNSPSNSTAGIPAVHQGLLSLLGDVWNHTIGPVFHDVNGGLKGLMNPALAQTAQLGPLVAGNPNVQMTGRGLEYKNAQMVNPLEGLMQGLLHPGQSIQEYNQNLQKTSKGQYGAGLADFALNTATNPLTWTPLGKPTEWALNAAGVTPALKYLSDLAKGTVKTGAEKSATPLTDAAINAMFGDTNPLGDLAKESKPAWTPAPEVNNWAGLTGGYDANAIPQVAKEVPTTIPKIAKPGEFLTPQASANNVLSQLFSKGAEAGLPAGREYETLQGMLGSMSGKDGLPLDQLIAKSANPTDITNLLPRLNMMKAAGLGAKDLAPQAFEQGTKTVLQDLPQAEQAAFSMRDALPPAVVPGEIAKDATQQAAQDAIAPIQDVGAQSSPYAKYKWQSALGKPIADYLQQQAPNGIPLIKQVMNAFNVLPGTTKGFQNLYSQYFGEKAALRNRMFNWLAETFKGASPQEQERIMQELEMLPVGQKLTDPKLAELQSKIEPRYDAYTKDLQKRGLLDETLKPEDYKVARHVPHIPLGKYIDGKFVPMDEPLAENEIVKGPMLQKSIRANKDRVMKGSLDSLAKQHLAAPTDVPLYEQNGVKMLGHYFGQANDAIAADNFIQKAMKAAEDNKTNIHPETGTENVPFTYKGKTVLMPKAEADVLNNLSQRSTEGAWGKLYRNSVNLMNKGMFLSNPLIHVVNNLGFQTLIHDPGAMPEVLDYMKEAINGIKPGGDMEQALKAGALNLSSEVGAKGARDKELEKLVSQINKGTVGKRSLLSKYNTFTPDVEKAYRTAIFKRSLKSGMSEAQASDYVRSIFGGHIAPNTMSVAERILTSLLPFGNWTKTALASNAKNFLKNPAPYIAMLQAANQTNEAATGHGLAGNSNPAAIGIPGSVNAQGKQQYIEPYFPAWDLMKLGKDIGKNGIAHGALDYLFSRMNPIAKGLSEDISSVQNPLAAGPNQFPLLPAPYLPVTDPHNQQGVFFGNNGPKIPGLDNPYVAPYTQAITVPGVQPLYDIQQGNGASALQNLLESLTGATLTAPNPQSQAKELAYQQRMARSESKKPVKTAQGK